MRKTNLQQINKSGGKSHVIHHLESLIQHLPGYVYWKNTDGIYLGTNHYLLIALELNTLAEIIGKNDYELWEAKYAKVIETHDREVITTGQTHTYYETIEYKNKKIYFASTKSPLRDINNRIIGIIGNSIEITELEEAKHKAEENSQAALTHFDSVIDCIPGNLYWKDKEGVYLGGNTIMMNAVGLKSKKELVGKTDHELFGVDKADTLRQNDKEVMEHGKVITIEEVANLPDGTQHFYMAAKMPLRDKENNIIGVIGNSLDITDLKRMEKALAIAKQKAEIADKAKSEFIANMSHDIRTPLTGILGLTQELIDVAGNSDIALQKIPSENNQAVTDYRELLHQLIEKVKENGQFLLGAADELLQLLNEILETMRLESGKIAETEEAFDLVELIEHNIALMMPIAKHKKLKLTSELDGCIPRYVKGLRSYLDRSLLNLLSNALKFTEKGFVKVNVELCSSSNYEIGDKVKLRITVEDSGVGIPEDQFDVIFEHFSRLTPSYQGIYKGAGLGLYTVKHYIHAMNAEIKVKSKLGHGTSFIITMPLIATDHADREKATYRSHASITQPCTPTFSSEVNKNATAKILIVEDNATAARAIALSITRLNKDCGYDIVDCGEDAIKIVKENQYAFILMDVGLPGIDGIETTKQIRNLNNCEAANTPILAVTGHANDPEKKAEALNAGMQAVFCKPLPPSTIESLMQEYIFNMKQETSKIQIHDDLEIIDWSKSLELCGGDENELEDILLIFESELKVSEEKLATFYAEGNTKALRAELHRVRGGLAYLTLPQLDKAFSEFHEAVATIPQDPKQITQLHEKLQREMKAFWSYSKKRRIIKQ